MKIAECNLRIIPTAQISDSVMKISRQLRDTKQRHIIILNKKTPVGIISTTDINNRLVAEDKDASDTKASEIMTKNIVIKDANEELTPAYMHLIKSNIFSCAVMKGNEFVGMLDLKEAMNKIVKEKYHAKKSRAA